MNATLLTRLILGALLLYQVYNYGHDHLVNRKRIND